MDKDKFQKIAKDVFNILEKDYLIMWLVDEDGEWQEHWEVGIIKDKYIGTRGELEIEVEHPKMKCLNFGYYLEHNALKVITGVWPQNSILDEIK